MAMPLMCISSAQCNSLIYRCQGFCAEVTNFAQTLGGLYARQAVLVTQRSRAFGLGRLRHRPRTKRRGPAFPCAPESAPQGRSRPAPQDAGLMAGGAEDADP